MLKRLTIALLSLIMVLPTYADEETLVIYSGRSESLVGPILAQFTQETGIPIDVRYGNTDTLTSQMVTEQGNSPADVVFFQESGYLGVLAEQGLLEPLDDSLLNQVDTPYRDEDGYWLGTSARMRVLAYNVDKFTGDDATSSLPKTLEELAKLDVVKAWTPGSPGYQAHVTALRDVLWGEEKTAAWLDTMQNSDISRFDGNGAMVTAVGRGEIDIAWTNHYYLYNVIVNDPDLSGRVANYHFPPIGKAGNLWIVSGAGIVKDTPHKEQALAFLNYLISEQAQEAFTGTSKLDTLTEVSFEYPTRIGVEPNPLLPNVDDVAFAQINQIVYTDIGPTLNMLREKNIL